MRRIHGAAAASEHLTGNLNFYTMYITDEVDITQTGSLEDQSQQNFDDVINLISLVAQPILMNNPISASLDSYAPTITGNGFIFKFAVEHGFVFSRNGDNVAILAELFDGVTIDNVLLQVGTNVEFTMSELL